MEFNKKIASYIIRNLNLDKDNEEVIAFSLDLLIIYLTNLSLTLIIAWLIGIFKESLAVLAVILILKLFSGGAHCSSAFNCTIFGILLTLLLGKLSKLLSLYTNLNCLIISSAFSILLSFILITKFAPVDSPAKPITSTIHKRRLRFFSILIIFLISIIQIVLFKTSKIFSVILAINISMLCQSLMLTKEGHIIVKCFDNFLTNIIRKGGENNEIHSTDSSS